MSSLPKRFLAWCSIVLVAAALQAGEPGHWSKAESFDAVASGFSETWDEKDLDQLGSILCLKLGIWVVYNRGVSSQPFRFETLSSAFADGEFGFGNLGLFRFDGCQPTAGQLPECRMDGGKAPVCQFGVAGAHFDELRALVLNDVNAKSNYPAAIERLEDLSSGREVHFLSDAEWGATFCFVATSEGWRLLLIDTSGCAA